MAARRRVPRELTGDVTFTVWQFVRVMVRLEETSRSRGNRPRDQLFAGWRDAWREVDQQLTRLGKEDPDGFADLMMEHEVVLSCPSKIQLNQVVQVIEEVAAQLSKSIAAREGGPEQLRHLKVERTELDKLKKRIAPNAKAKKSC